MTPEEGTPLKVLIALDSFKGSASSADAGEWVRQGILVADPTAEVTVVAIADGGEGTLAAIEHARAHTSGDVERVTVATVDAVGRPLQADYLLLDDGQTAVLEAAQTIGLPAVGVVDETLPLRASSRGLGDQLADALARDARRVLIGLGGTATTDGGLGLLQALGFCVHPEPGREIDGWTNPLWSLGSFVADSFPTTPPGVEIVALTDVSNPLLGHSGAAAVFGPQKGATASQVLHLESKMELWARALTKQTGRDLVIVPGAGAAGGIAAALLGLGARIRPGFGWVSELVGLAEQVAWADLVITGEGSLDPQSSLGKGPVGVAQLARQAGVVVVALGGRVDRSPDVAAHFDAVLPIHSRPRDVAQAMDPKVTEIELRNSAEQLLRLMMASRR